MLSLLSALGLGYMWGSIPFGLIITRAAGMGDVRNIGSGNIGATNVLRTGNKGLAIATLLLDLVKGVIPILLCKWWFPEYAGWAALAAVVGHCFPIWLGFKGGKGVATCAGVCFGLALPLGLVYAGVWIAVLLIFRISSLSGLSAVIAAAIYAAVLGPSVFFPPLFAIALLVIIQHRDNIMRLRLGQEPKVGGKK